MKLKEVGIANYASIGSSPVWIDLQSKVNVLIGQNNSGKSNVIRGLTTLLRHAPDLRDVRPIDRHMRNEACVPELWLRAVPESQQDQSIVVDREYIELGMKLGVNSDDRWAVEPLVEVPWYPLNEEHGRRLGSRIAGVVSGQTLQRIRIAVANSYVNELLSVRPPTQIIPQFRKITAADTDNPFDGAGQVRTLHKWQHPKVGKEADRVRFRNVETLFQHLTGLADARLEVDHDAATIIVSRETIRLPLDSYGTGIHQILLMAVCFYSTENTVFFIEEPEIHLHPTLQRKLMGFLLRETSNTFVITTHSSALINSAATIVHLKLREAKTVERRISTTAGSLDVLNDLGYKPSDLLQTNFVVWVEGPSDRIYINRWISLFDESLNEGSDYSIMFYGGKLASHLTLERDGDGDAERMIQLLSICQSAAIIMDSDKRQATDAINATKDRIQNECGRQSALCWVTTGREIENYVPANVWNAVYTEQTGRPIEITLGDYDKADGCIDAVLAADDPQRLKYSTNKPVLSRLIAAKIERADVNGELETMLNELVAAIRAACR